MKRPVVRLILLILIGLGLQFGVLRVTEAGGAPGTADDGARRSPAIQAANASNANALVVMLPVTVLPTGFGLPDESAPAYPATINVEAAPGLQLAAYGAARQVWLAPRSWTGAGAVGADGNISFHLYPIGSDGSSGPNITYASISACVGCMLSRAALYFPEALTQWNEEYNADGKNPVAVRGDLAVTKVTPQLVTYKLPNEDNLLVRGAAFYDTRGDAFYAEARLTLPAADDRLAEFLLKYFSDHTGLR
jgi:hypothetical protein